MLYVVLTSATGWRPPHISMFIDPPSLIIVAGFCVGGLLYSYAYGLRTAARAVFDSAADRASIQMSVAVLQRAKTFAIVGGVIGTLIGMGTMLAGMTGGPWISISGTAPVTPSRLAWPSRS